MDAMNRMFKSFENTASEEPEAQAHPSRHQWDLFSLKLLPAAQAEQLSAHAENCAQCRSMIGSIEHQRTEWAEQASWPVLEKRLMSAPSRWGALAAQWNEFWRAALWAPVGALGLFVALWTLAPGESPLLPTTPSQTNQTNQVHSPIAPYLGKKGIGNSSLSPVLRVYRFRKGVRQLARSHESFQKGDVLGFTYESKGYQYLFVVHVDQKGEISWLYPDHTGQSIRVAAHGRLKGSVELDQAPGRERLVAFFSALPLQSSEVKKLLSTISIQTREGAISLPHQPAQNIFMLQMILQKQ